MKKELKQIIEQNKADEKVQSDAIHAEIVNPDTSNDRRKIGRASCRERV